MLVPGQLPGVGGNDVAAAAVSPDVRCGHGYRLVSSTAGSGAGLVHQKSHPRPCPPSQAAAATRSSICNTDI
jgi:hypothetical protein